MAESKAPRIKRTNIEFPHPAHSQYVKLLTVTMYDVQELRKSIENRIGALKRRAVAEKLEVCDTIAEELKVFAGKTISRLENEFESRIAGAVEKMPIMLWLDKVYGIGPRYKGSLVSIIQDINRFSRISRIWGYFGMGLVPVCDNCDKLAYEGEDRIRFCMRQASRRWLIYTTSRRYEEQLEKGKAQDEETFVEEKHKYTEGELCKHTNDEDFSYTLRAPQKHFFSGLLLTHNPFAKMTIWKISGQFVRQGKFYRTRYEVAKAKYVKRDSGKIADWIIDLRARRAVSKLFLSHLWEMWRRSEGLPVGKTWLLSQQGMDFENHTYIPPPYANTYGPFEEYKLSAD